MSLQPAMPASITALSLLLAKAATPKQLSQVGNRSGGRVFLFFHSDDFWGDYHRMQAHGARFAEKLRQ